MSDGNDFDQFMNAARADVAARASTTDDAQRVKTSLGTLVSLRGHLPPAISAALDRTTATASITAEGGAIGDVATTGIAASSSWMNSAALLLPVLALAVASASILTFSSNTPSPPPSASVADHTPAASAQATESAASNAAPPVLAGPADLPDAKDPIPPKDARLAKPIAPHAIPPAPGTLEAELALLSQVTSALHTNLPARALALVDEHDRRFKDGALMPEFNAQRVLALASLGRQSEACVESAKFLAKYPKSPFVSQVRSSCVNPNSGR